MTQLTLVADPLPTTNEGFQLRTKPSSLNDRAKEYLMNGLWPLVQPYFEAVDNKHAKEGSIPMDRAAAATEFRQFGKKKGDEVVSNASLAKLDHALNVAARAIKAADGKPIDRNSRKRLAIGYAKTSQPSPTADNG